ncbi:uncharacterized protein LOC111272647 isoform X2 [Varroa jacobsoni]|uniref:Uncharacterized protein n=1 Tax=Varroa destructor TaxID=109461 RepID=A0A7M7JKE5_VARDE|nr:uncharacterized protein LOC111246798 isoform X2 [Varroa destructor]XP_022709970.1 uncharacterized protein LOC111272647 isoform X2 [Varroa jacobsoni]
MSTNDAKKPLGGNRQESNDVTDGIGGPANGADFLLPYIDPSRRYSDGNRWRSKRSRCVDRLRLEGINQRIEFYDRLQKVLMTRRSLLHESTSNPDAKVTVTQQQFGVKPRPKGQGLPNLTGIDKVTQHSLGSGDGSMKDLFAGIGQHYDEELSFSSTCSDAERDWKLAEEFNTSLGMEMIQFRREIEEILADHPMGILFPVELTGAYYSKVGRPIKNCTQDFSFEALYAWLRCFTSLDISRLIL